MAAPKKLKILFVTSEVLPFVKTGGLADVSQALPQTLMELGHEIRIVVPKYGAIDERKYKIHEIVRLKDLHTQIGEKDVVYSLRSCFLTGPKTKVQIYFLDNHAIIFIVLAAGILTPGTDPVSQIALAIPLVLLYEISIFVSKISQKKK